MLCSFVSWPREVWQVITDVSEKRTAYVFRAEESEAGDSSSCPTLASNDKITWCQVPEEMTLQKNSKKWLSLHTKTNTEKAIEIYIFLWCSTSAPKIKSRRWALCKDRLQEQTGLKAVPKVQERSCSGSLIPRILKPGIKWRWVVSSIPRLLYPQETSLVSQVGPQADLDAVLWRSDISSPTRI